MINKTLCSWLQLLSLLLLLTASELMAQDHNVAGNLSVYGKADILSGPLSLGTAHFFDENSVESLAEGLTIHYSETPQNWSGSNYVKGNSSVILRVAQELASFTWQISEPDGQDGFTSGTLMQLSNTGLSVNGQVNLLPNQTLSGDASIMTRVLSDARYLRGANDLTGALSWGSDVSATTYHSIALGHAAAAGQTSISIGSGAGQNGSGQAAVAVGFWATAPGEAAVALGNGAAANGSKSVALGQASVAQATRSLAFGVGTHTAHIGQISLGSYNVIETVTATESANQNLFVIGNGTADNARSNALVVRRNGDMEVKGTSLTVNGQQVLTSATDCLRHVDGSYGVIGSYSYPWSSAIAVGHFARAGESSVAIGAHTGMWEPGASGVKSVAIGYVARAPGDYSVAVGAETWAGAAEVVTIGRNANAFQLGAIAIGRGTKSSHPGQVVLGAFNVESSYAAANYPTNDLLILGNGTADDARSNALIVKRNGNMEVKGTSLTVNGAEVLTQAALDDAIEDVNLGAGNYISRNGDIGMIYGTSATAAAHSMALGQNTTASGSQSSSAMGYYATANQQGTHALGSHVVANRPGQIVLGNYNDYGTPLAGSDTPASTDPVFVIGNGTADNARSNALVITRGGAIELAGTSLKYNNSNILTEAAGNTLYLTQSSASSTYLTSTAAASQYQPKLTGTDVYLTSIDLVAIQASIDEKLGLADLEDIIEGLEDSFLSKDPEVGLAYGTGSTAIAGTSAIGTGAKANQAGAHAMGNNVVANRPGQVVVGNYNDYGTTEAGSNVESATDPVFVVGVGAAGESGQPDVRKNALTVKRNGDIEASGSIKVDGVIRVQPAGNLSMGDYQSIPGAP